jgi:hypothetical protein
MRARIVALALVSTLLVPIQAGAQIGTPGTGPLVPGGPRQGIGPPSITDAVPDIRLRSDGGGIPGAGPPIDYGRSPVRSFGNSGMGARAMPRYRQASGRHCETSRSTCALTRATPLGTACSCRVRGKAARARGFVVY